MYPYCNDVIIMSYFVSLEPLLAAWAYEAKRLFRDRLVGDKSHSQFDAILTSVLQSDWSVDGLDQEGSAFYVTWGAGHAPSSGAVMAPFGRPLGRLSATDLQEIIGSGIVSYGKCMYL